MSTRPPFLTVLAITSVKRASRSRRGWWDCTPYVDSTTHTSGDTCAVNWVSVHCGAVMPLVTLLSWVELDESLSWG
jgi:hypothetical protein